MKVLVSDFARVLVFTADPSYSGSMDYLFSITSGQKIPFFKTFTLNTELLETIEKIPTSQKYVFTAGHIHTDPEIAKIILKVFNQVYTASELGFKKNNPEAFTTLASKIGVKPSDIVFIDDKIDNIHAAKAAGCTAIQYLDNDQVRAELLAALD